MMNNRGFTLVELIAILIIIALLLLVSFPVITNVLKNSEEKNYEIIVKNVETAAESYLVECLNGTLTCTKTNNNYKVTARELITLGFIKVGNIDSDVEEIYDCLKVTIIPTSNYKYTYTLNKGECEP